MLNNIVHVYKTVEPLNVEATYNNALLPAIHECPELQSYSRYFVSTYISETARFPPKLWARFPNVYKFAMILLGRQELTYVKLQGLAAQRRPDSLMKLREIQEHCDNLTRGHLTSYEFIHKLSFKFLPVID